MSKIALVESGGGMAACYIAGVNCALAEKVKFTAPDIAIGGSGSAPNLAYYLSGQCQTMKDIWLNMLSDSNFINPWRLWRVIDIDYLVDEIFKKQRPLKVKKVYNSQTKYFIASTNHKTGKLEYFCNQNKDDIFEAMRASMAMPIAFNKYIKVRYKEFCDSHLSASVHLNIKKAVDLGADKIIVASVEDLHPAKFGNLAYNWWLKRQNKRFLKNYNQEESRTFNIPKNVEILYIKPKKVLKVGTFDNDKKSLKQVFNQGYKDVVNNKELKEFLYSK